MSVESTHKLQNPASNRRKYIRIETILPVEFSLIDIQSGKTVALSLQGFSNNISKEGICLSAKNIDPAYLVSIRNKQVKLSLKIHLPFRPKPVESLAAIAWLKEAPDESSFHSIGLHYEQIDKKENSFILRFARLKRLFVPVMLSVLLLLLALAGSGAYFNWKLSKDNESLTEQMTKALGEAAAARQRLTEISSQKKELESKISGLESDIKSIETQKLEFETMARKKESAASQEIERLSNLSVSLQKDKETLENDLTSLSKQEGIAKDEFNQFVQDAMVSVQEKGLNSQVSEDGQYIQIWHDQDGERIKDDQAK